MACSIRDNSCSAREYFVNDYFTYFVVLQLHREFCRAGSDIAQAFTFYASEDKLENRGNKAGKLGVCFDWWI